ncbi:MAG: hypothetical protein ACFFEX_08420 [Candidatus Thorarchaeota archaeon]
MTRIGSAVDSLSILLLIALTTTAAVMAIAVWRGALSGHLRKGMAWRKPLLLPSIVFTITLFVAMIYAPYPMKAYHGLNQINNLGPFQGAFRVYETVAYDADVQIRIIASLASNERLEVNVTISQEGSIIGLIVIDANAEDFDHYGGLTRSTNLPEGVYDVTVNGTRYIDDNPEQIQFLDFTLNQPVTNEFISEITQWNALRFFIVFGSLFFVLGGICYDRGNPRKERRWENTQEGEIFRKAHTR